MNLVIAITLIILFGLLTLASYVDRLYAEIGKFLSREFQDNIDVFEQQVEPKLKVSRSRAALSMAVMTPLLMAAVAMVVRGQNARDQHLTKMSDLVPLAPQWRVGVGYEFLERPDGYRGWTERYGLKFGKAPSVLDLGLIYRALAEKKVDIVAGNSTDGLIDALGFVPLQDDRHYFPPYDAVPIVRRAALQKFPQLRAALADLGGKISEDEMRRLNRQVDADQRDVATVVREFRASKGL